MNMPHLQLPAFSYRFNGKCIFDILRKRYIPLTQEEWVRQHWVHYLIDHLGYPKGLIRLEAVLYAQGRRHRPDLLVYNHQGTPYLLLECKSPSVTLDWITLSQLSRYNGILYTKFLAISNGQTHLCWERNTAKYNTIESLPIFSSDAYTFTVP